MEMAEGKLPNLPGASGWITPEEAADMMNVTAQHIRLLCRKRRIGGMKERGRWWVSKMSARLYRRNLSNRRVFEKVISQEFSGDDHGA